MYKPLITLIAGIIWILGFITGNLFIHQYGTLIILVWAIIWAICLIIASNELISFLENKDE